MAVKRNVNKEKHESHTTNRLLSNIFAVGVKGGFGVKQHRNFKISYLRCTVCGSIMPIPRRFGRFREKNHIKTMYCYKCDAERDFLENTEDERYSDELPDEFGSETDIPAGINANNPTPNANANTDEDTVADIQSEENDEFYYRFPEPPEKYW